MTLQQGDVLQLPAPAEAGLLITNPPYGHRMGEGEALKTFYAQFGDPINLLTIIQPTKKTMNRNLFLLVFFFIGITAVQAQTADEIIANYFENTGGQAKWKALESLKRRP